MDNCKDCDNVVEFIWDSFAKKLFYSFPGKPDVLATDNSLYELNWFLSRKTNVVFNFYRDGEHFGILRNARKVYFLPHKDSRFLFTQFNCKGKIVKKTSSDMCTVSEETNIEFVNVWEIGLFDESAIYLETIPEIWLSKTKPAAASYYYHKQFLKCSDTGEGGSKFITFSVVDSVGVALVESILSKHYNIKKLECDAPDVNNYQLFISHPAQLLPYLHFLMEKGHITYPTLNGVEIASTLAKVKQLSLIVKTPFGDKSISAEIIADLSEEEKQLWDRCGHELDRLFEYVSSKFGCFFFDCVGQQFDSYSMKLLEFRYKQDLDVLMSSGLVVPKWKGEFSLFTLVRHYFDDAVYQYRSSWLGLQSLDIFIPSLHVALEYQGIQHFEPIEFFGGEVGFVERAERDIRKKKVCSENKVTLLYWDYDEDVTAENLFIKFRNIGIELPERKNCDLPSLKLGKPQSSRDSQPVHHISIYQYSKDFNLSATFKTIAEAAICAGISSTSIRKAINGERFLAGGYFWFQGENPLESIPESWLQFADMGYKSIPSKRVRQISLDGGIIAEYKSIGAAAKATQSSKCGIRSVLNGTQKTCNGYRWEECK